LDLLIITPWKEEWFSNEVFSFPEIFYLRERLKGLIEYEVISPGEKPKYDKYKTVWCQSEIPYPYAKEIVSKVKPNKFLVSIYGILERFPLRLRNKIFYPLHLYRYRKLDYAFKGGADLFLIYDDGSMGEKLAEKYRVNYITLLNPKPEFERLDKCSAREILKLPKNSVIGAFIGRFSKFKGIEFLPKIYQKGDPYTLILVGSGDARELKTWAKEVQSIIIEQIPHTLMNLVYSAVDFVIMPYIYGNITTVMVESLYFGLPTVSFKAHSTDRIIKNGENGFYAENFKVKDFREYSLLLAKEEDLRRKIGENAHKTSRIFPTWQEHTEKIIHQLI
jgi:glycosyltransferase involved in cell wall biosynthesis